MDHPDPDTVIPEPAPEAGRSLLPDPAVCHVSQIDASKVYHCHVRSPHHCPHVISFAQSNFCNNPDRTQFLRMPAGSGIGK